MIVNYMRDIIEMVRIITESFTGNIEPRLDPEEP